jgi:hypothetical protein
MHERRDEDEEARDQERAQVAAHAEDDREPAEDGGDTRQGTPSSASGTLYDFAYWTPWRPWSPSSHLGTAKDLW